MCDVEKTLALIPQPKELLCREGVFKVGSGSAVVSTANAIREAKIFLEDAADIPGYNLRPDIEVAGLPYEILALGDVKALKLPERSVFDGLGEEGYLLLITEKAAAVISSRRQGIFTGAQTLLQLMENGPDLPCLEIRDWPALQMRGVHLMLACQTPTFAYLKSFIKQISRYKINTILLEYEDKYPYKSHPVIRHKDALTEEEIGELINEAQKRHLEIIPLVQWFAHVKYILKHEEYSYLREKPLDPYQFCPSHEQSFKLFMDLASEVMAAHKDSKYFHIGGDETYHLGICPACHEKVERYGKSKFFIEAVNKAAGYIRESGKKPILWDDQLAWFPEAIDSLDKDITIMYWDYLGGDTETVPFVKWENRAWFGQEALENIPPHIIDTFKDYWGEDGFPYVNRPFPYLRFYQDHGLQVICGSAKRPGPSGLINVDDRITIPNIRGFAVSAAANRALGTIATSWPEAGGPLETTWHGVAATAEFAWAPEEARADFECKFRRRFYGADTEALTQAMYLLGGNIQPWNTAEMKHRTENALALLGRVEPLISRNKGNYDLLSLAGRMRLLFIEAVRLGSEIDESIIGRTDKSRWRKDKATGNRGSLSCSFESRDVAGLSLAVLIDTVNRLRNIREKIELLKVDIRNRYSETVIADDIEDAIDRVFEGPDGKLKEYISQIEYFIAVRKLEQYRQSMEIEA
ncbi:MAG: family 20 glycosylhydrolase [bacterium]|nr:family 20 glycosylhydrolase [bacterium]